MEELGPCPACGNADCSIRHSASVVRGMEVTWLDCRKCDFRIRGFGIRRMIRVWNSLGQLPPMCQEDIDDASYELDSEARGYVDDMRAFRHSVMALNLAAKADMYGETVEEYLSQPKED